MKTIVSSEPTADLPLAKFVDEITSRLQAGEQVDIEELTQQYPEKADELRQLLPALQLLAGVGQTARFAVDSPVSESRASIQPDQDGDGHQALGDFHILREIGRGGMGVVYEAEQLSLGRRVALKVLPLAATLNTQQLERFKNESRAAATLRHPHIVGIYAVGVDRGVHYYAMELIEGQSLAQLIAAMRSSCPPPPSAGEGLGLRFAHFLSRVSRS